MISNEVARVAPFYHRTWQRVPDEIKRDIYTTIYQYFDLVSFEDTSEWPGVQLGIQAECQRSYSARKSKYKSHYDTYEDVETAKNNPPDDFASEPERWIEIIDRLYQDPRYINQCEKNRQNRTKLRYTSYHGTQSYAQKRHMRVSCIQI
ncbi:hypothetical protein Hanom_Chr16g01471371 [Helianthus anomalus]